MWHGSVNSLCPPKNRVQPHTQSKKHSATTVCVCVSRRRSVFSPLPVSSVGPVVSADKAPVSLCPLLTQIVLVRRCVCVCVYVQTGDWGRVRASTPKINTLQIDSSHFGPKIFLSFHRHTHPKAIIPRRIGHSKGFWVKGGFKKVCVCQDHHSVLLFSLTNLFKGRSRFNCQ